MIPRFAWPLSAALLLCGCPGPTPPPPPQAPKVTFSPLPREVVGVGLTFIVQVNGCGAGVIKKVWITEHDDQVAEQDGGAETNTLSATSSAFDYQSRGIPAALALYAHATCEWTTDGGVIDLTGDSDEEPVNFMPALEVDPGPWPFGPNFWVDDDASSLLTCDGTTMSRLGKDKSPKGSFGLRFTCDANTLVAFGGDGMRYLLDSGIGISEFSDGMQEQALQLNSTSDFSPEQLIGPVGGLLFVVGSNGVGQQLNAYDTTTGELAGGGVPLAGSLAGSVMLNTLGEIVCPMYTEDLSNNVVHLTLQLYSETEGKFVAAHDLGTIPTSPEGNTPVPFISFDESGSTAYFAEILDPSHVWACDTSALTCTGPGLLWQSAPLPGGVVSATRTNNALVAWGAHVAYFLDPSTGAPLTDSTAPFQTQGGLVYVAVVGAVDGSTYLFAQAQDASGNFLAGIKEIQIFDKPNQLLTDFVSETAGYVVDLDVHGRAWLWNYDLTPLMLPSDYRQVLSQ